ncbi:hypothetical protein J6590_082412 [Homalodisca vitripennis]|nr:hypothetical protein J6590_082412 [Homalodisca vitripennis]
MKSQVEIDLLQAVARKKMLYVIMLSEPNIRTAHNGTCCYFPPGKPIREFEEGLEELANFRRNSRKGVVIGGDFNAKAEEWG